MSAAEARDKDINCIMLFLLGGPSHIDTFDPKPKAPAEVRGPFQPIKTNVAGIEISEHFPQFAQVMNHAAILRGMSTPEGAHGRARYYMHTGYREGLGGLTYPSLGALVASELGQAEDPLKSGPPVGTRNNRGGFYPQFVAGPGSGERRCPV